MGDLRESLAKLVPGAMNLGGTGGEGDMRQQLMSALARVRPQWAGDLLLAMYADDASALKQVSYALMQELAAMTYQEKHPPGTLRKVAYAVLAEYTDPPPCLACHGTAKTWQLVDGAVTAIDCPSCNGQGRRRMTDDEREQTLDNWDVWAPRYAAMHRMLRAHERAALSVLRDAIG